MLSSYRGKSVLCHLLWGGYTFKREWNINLCQWRWQNARNNQTRQECDEKASSFLFCLFFFSFGFILNSVITPSGLENYTLCSGDWTSSNMCKASTFPIVLSLWTSNFTINKTVVWFSLYGNKIMEASHESFHMTYWLHLSASTFPQALSAKSLIFKNAHTPI